MSHGRIFMFVTDRKEIEGDNYYCPFNEEQMREWIPGCDYVCRQNKNEFLDDLVWLSETYGVIDSEGIEKLKEELIKQKRERIEKVKHELEKPESDISMWRVSYVTHIQPRVFTLFLPT